MSIIYRQSVFHRQGLFQWLWTAVLTLVILGGWPTTQSVGANSAPRIQELVATMEERRGIVYTLHDLRKGDILHAYLENTKGNLDPFLGIIKDGVDPDLMHEALLKSVKNTTGDFNKAFAQFADTHFLTWDDDSGKGYAAALKFDVPADGTYFLLSGSMLTNQSYTEFTPRLTAGSYRLLIGLNAPSVGGGKGQPTGKVFATIDPKFVKPQIHIQHLSQRLTTHKQIFLHDLKTLQPGDIFYARLEMAGAHSLPELYLSDFGGKPLAFGKPDESGNAITLTHNNQEGGAGLNLVINGTGIETIPNGAEYNLVVGLNDAEVLNGAIAARGLPVVKGSKQVLIGLTIDQIANVDQQSENFTIVGSLEMIWQDSDLSFSPDSCKCAIKNMGIGELRAMAIENEIILPNFTFSNQQGNRWSQNQIIFIEPSGQATYHERFTVTLQAPDFDFRAYPFDQQQFNVRFDLSVPTELYTFQAMGAPEDVLGDQLGEEEWTVVKIGQETTELPFNEALTKSRYTLSMHMKRHLNFYMYRIFIPLFLIISVSWVIFFLKDYGKQLEVASGNLLVFVAFNFTISDDLPRLGYLTLLDRMIIASFGCTALVVFISVCQKRLEANGRMELASRIDTWVLTLYPILYVLLVAMEYFLVISKIGT